MFWYMELLVAFLLVPFQFSNLVPFCHYLHCTGALKWVKLKTIYAGGEDDVLA